MLIILKVCTIAIPVKAIIFLNKIPGLMFCISPMKRYRNVRIDTDSEQPDASDLDLNLPQDDLFDVSMDGKAGDYMEDAFSQDILTEDLTEMPDAEE